MTWIETPAGTLAITVLIEWLVLAAAVRRGLVNLLLVSLLINALTQPIASWIVEQHSNWTALALVEISVVVIESVLLAQLLEFRVRRAARLSLMANGASALIGVVLFWLR